MPFQTTVLAVNSLTVFIEATISLGFITLDAIDELFVFPILDEGLKEVIKGLVIRMTIAVRWVKVD